MSTLVMGDMLMGGIMQREPPHGIKRAASDNLEREQRLTKRFNLLNLGHHGGKLYIPSVSSAAPHATSCDIVPNHAEPISNGYSDTSSECDGMQVEDTPNRIYISDLDAEIASLEPSSPTHPIFLPDIEKHLLGLPSSVLGPTAEEEEERRERELSMQMVVYGVPTSLSLPEEQDNVRRAIEEARRRVRARMPLGGQIEYAVAGMVPNWKGHQRQRHADSYSSDWQANDPDAMDMEL